MAQIQTALAAVSALKGGGGTPTSPASLPNFTNTLSSEAKSGGTVGFGAIDFGGITKNQKTSFITYGIFAITAIILLKIYRRH